MQFQITGLLGLEPELSFACRSKHQKAEGTLETLPVNVKEHKYLTLQIKFYLLFIIPHDRMHRVRCPLDKDTACAVQGVIRTNAKNEII
jgi:hypothetical protein